MDHAQKVVWSEGMFLTPHHFQQADRHLEQLLQRRFAALHPRGWGVCRLQIDGDALANGEFLVSRLQAVTADGLSVDAPDYDALPPARAIEGAFDPKKTSLGVYVAAPLTRPGQVSSSPDGQAGGRAVRYRRRPVTVADESGGGEREIEVAAKNLRILFEGEPREDHSSMKIAELVRTAAGKFAVSESHVPPCLYLSASSSLTGALRRVLEMISAKSSELTAQRRQRSQGLVEFTMSEAANFWFLHTVNAFIPVLMHHHRNPEVHPELPFLALARLAGELFTFAGEGHAKDLPVYEHDVPGASYAAMERRISDLLGTVIPTRCVPVPLEKMRESLYTGKFRDDRVVETGQLYLAVSAEVPEEKIIREVPLKAKAASTDRVDQLIAAAMRGLPLRHLPTPPAEIPVQPGRQYFQLEKSGEQWEAVRKSRSISFYIPPEFKGLKLELMAVKE